MARICWHTAFGCWVNGLLQSFCNKSLVLSRERRASRAIRVQNSVLPFHLLFYISLTYQEGEITQCPAERRLFGRNTFCGKALRVIVPCEGVFVPPIPSRRMWENIFRKHPKKLSAMHELSTDLLLRECVLWIHLNLEHSLREHEKDTCTDFPPKDAALSGKKWIRPVPLLLYSFAWENKGNTK